MKTYTFILHCAALNILTPGMRKIVDIREMSTTYCEHPKNSMILSFRIIELNDAQFFRTLKLRWVCNFRNMLNMIIYYCYSVIFYSLRAKVDADTAEHGYPKQGSFRSKILRSKTRSHVPTPPRSLPRRRCFRHAYSISVSCTPLHNVR